MKLRCLLLAVARRSFVRLVCSRRRMTQPQAAAVFKKCAVCHTATEHREPRRAVADGGGRSPRCHRTGLQLFCRR